MSNKLENERTMTNKELFKKLFRYLKPELGKFLLAILMLMISVGCGLAIPLLNGETIKVMGETVVNYNEILKKEHPEVAIVVRDSMAVSFINVARLLHIQIPDDMQVIGFQNTRYAQLSNPKLTCAEIPVYEMGSNAMSYLTKLMKEDYNKHKKAEKILLPYDIVWRESTK